LSKQVHDKINSLKALTNKLKEMRLYLENVYTGKFRYNHLIIQNFQDIFNLLPNLQIEEMIKAFSVKTNDYMYVLYVSSLIKSVVSLHNLINNKISNKETEIEEAKKAKEAEEEKKRLEEERKKLEAEKEKKDKAKADKEEKKDDKKDKS